MEDFIVETYGRKKAYEKCPWKFKILFPGVLVLSKSCMSQCRRTSVRMPKLT